MKKLNFITNLKTILTDIRVIKNMIRQTDETQQIFVISKASEEVFADDFAIRDLTAFEKVSKDAENFVENETEIILSKGDITINWKKAESDIIPNYKDKEPELDYKDAVKIILTDEVKAKLLQAMDTEFSNAIFIFSKDGSICCSVGGDEGKHKFTAVLSQTDKSVNAKFQIGFLKSVVKSLFGYSELELKTNFPARITDKIEKEYDLIVYLAPMTIYNDNIR